MLNKYIVFILAMLISTIFLDIRDLYIITHKNPNNIIKTLYYMGIIIPFGFGVTYLLLSKVTENENTKNKKYW